MRCMSPVTPQFSSSSLRWAGLAAALLTWNATPSHSAPAGTLPAISIGNARVVEGDAGSKAMTFRVTATGPACAPISVDWATQNGTARADSGDFTAASGTVTLATPEPVFSESWDAGGAGFIRDLAVAPNGDVYAVDQPNARVLRFHPDGTLVLSWGSPGSGNGQFAQPIGITVDAVGNVYVADTENQRVQKFDASGGWLGQFALPFAASADLRPVDIAADAAGHVYVSAFGTIAQFDTAGNYLMQWGSGGPRPFSIAVGSTGNVYAMVSDTNGTVSRMHVFAPDSTPVATWAPASTAGQARGIATVAIDGCGHVFIADLDRVAIADENGNWIAEWSDIPTDTSIVAKPYAVAANGRGDVYLAQDQYPRIVHFTTRHAGSLAVTITGDVQTEADEAFTVVLSNPSGSAIANGTGTGTILNDDSDVGPNLAGNPDFESSLLGWAGTGSSTITASPNSHTGSWAALVTSPDSIKTFGLNDSPDWVAAADSDWARYRFTAWVKLAAGTGSARLRVREYSGLVFQGASQTLGVPIDATWRKLSLAVLTVFRGSHFDFQVLMDPNESGDAFLVDDVAIQRLYGDVAPIVTAPELLTQSWQRSMPFNVQAYDPDGDVVRSFAADVSGLPPGNDASLQLTSDRLTGTFAWEPGIGAQRNLPYTVVFTAGNAMSGSDTTRIQVNRNLAGNASFETGLDGWNGNQAELTWAAPGRADGHAARVTNVLGRSTFGITDSPDWATSYGAGSIYNYSAWVRSDAGTEPMWLWVREYGPTGALITSVSTPRQPVGSDWVNLAERYSALGLNSTLDFLVMRGSGGAGDRFDVDDVKISTESLPVLAVPEPERAVVRQLVSPNPMRSQAFLRFAVTRTGPLKAELIDVSGRVVRVLADEPAAAPGIHSWTLRAHDTQGRAMAPGVYFYRVRSADGVQNGRFVILN